MHKKKYHIKTWGCQMNVYDSQRIGEILQSIGYEKTDDVSESSLVILNTCHIREKATEKVYSDIGRLKLLKERRSKLGLGLVIGVAGCVAQAEGEEILKRAPVVDLVFGPQTWHYLPDMLTKIEQQQQKICNTEFPAEEKFDNLVGEFDKDRISAGSSFIAIQEGCDKFCTYCVVPYTRGAEYSRPLAQILVELNQLLDNGAKEITLLGQNVNAYHGKDLDGNELTFGKLIRKIASLPKLECIRYVTSYPAEVDDDLIMAHKDVAKLSPFIHLPIQSGSNAILKAMNRNHTAEYYCDIIARFHQVRDDLAFSSDFIVGFPGETDDDFQQTLAIIEKIRFIQSFSFMYSIRPGTPAALMDNQVDDKIKGQRLFKLQQLLAEIQQQFNDASVGNEYRVLLNRVGKQSNQLVGKSPYMQAVIIDDIAPNMIGSTVDVKIIASGKNSLRGVML